MTGDIAMPAMLGLRTRRLHVAVGLLLGVYVAVRATAFGEPRSVISWVLETVAVVGFAGCLFGVAAGEKDPLPRTAAGAVAVCATGSVAAAWWAVPLGADAWVQPGTAVVVFAVVVGLLSLRGRAALAWGMCGVVLVLAVGWSLQRGGTVIAGGQITLRMMVALLPATLMAAQMRPMLALTGALQARRAQTVRDVAVTAATDLERAERLRRFDAEVRPCLQRVVDGDEFDAADVCRAHLLENDLRDAVRGRGWWNATTRAAIAAARERGVVVRILDDRATPLADGDLPVVHERLTAVLHATTAGVVTARLLPLGRESVAVLTVVTADQVERTVCTRRRGLLQWSASEAVG